MAFNSLKKKLWIIASQTNQIFTHPSSSSSPLPPPPSSLGQPTLIDTNLHLRSESPPVAGHHLQPSSPPVNHTPLSRRFSQPPPVHSHPRRNRPSTTAISGSVLVCSRCVIYESSSKQYYRQTRA
ncbi:hypothetical protein Hdeb2414_s0036g00730391 [Helianthus debilis subsp. tardiflorus]